MCFILPESLLWPTDIVIRLPLRDFDSYKWLESAMLITNVPKTIKVALFIGTNIQFLLTKFLPYPTLPLHLLWIEVCKYQIKAGLQSGHLNSSVDSKIKLKMQT